MLLDKLEQQVYDAFKRSFDSDIQGACVAIPVERWYVMIYKREWSMQTSPDQQKELVRVRVANAKRLSGE